MKKTDYVDFQKRTEPLAYLITFRCYGTWLHGDQRGSIDRILHAVNVRTNHVHSVVSAPCKPEHVMDSFKAYATRHLRESGLFSRDIKPCARHGSTPYLWTEEEVERAIDYVINGQGEEPFR